MEIVKNYFAEHILDSSKNTSPNTSPLYVKYKLLTLKNPSNTCLDEDLLRVEYHMRGLIGYSNVLHQWFENGKQNQRHLHCIIEKAQMPDKLKLGKISSSFKRTIIKYLDFGPSAEASNSPLCSVVCKLPLKKYLWNLTPFQSDVHFMYVKNDYSKKEKMSRYNASPQFIDSD